MANEKQFRELKFSSTQLVVVFLAILALGVFIFLLGISVGKRQAGLLASKGQAASGEAEVVVQKQAPPAVTDSSARQLEAQGASKQVAEPGTQAIPGSAVKNAVPADKIPEDKGLVAKAIPVEK